jgi:hypothetical protein
MSEREIDQFLTDLSEVTTDVIDQVDKMDGVAVFLLGTRMVDDDEGGLQTFINVRGEFAVLEEGLYAELSEQVQEGKLLLFAALRQVIRDIEEEYSLEDADFTPEVEVRGHLH